MSKLQFAVRGFSPRHGKYVTLFSPYNVKMEAIAKMFELQDRNPQINYIVTCTHECDDLQSA